MPNTKTTAGLGAVAAIVAAAGTYVATTSSPAKPWCWYEEGQECYKLADLGVDKCPLGTIAVTTCPPPVVQPTPVTPKPTPKPTMPVPPISGPPQPLPTPTIPGPGFIEIYHTNNASILIVDGKLQWQQIHPTGNVWQVKLTYQSIPTISGGN